MDKRFDVFLSHNSKDKPAVRELAEALQDRGLTVWLDEWELVPGGLWQEALEEVIETTGAAAVLVGKDGLGPWQDQEMRVCLNEFVQRKLRVIPVLLPGAPEKPRLPMFLSGFTWVDLRAGLTEDGLGRLQWGITGRRPDRAPRPSPPAAAPKAAQPVSSSPQRKWPVRPLPVLFGIAALAAVIALGALLAQRLKGLPAGKAACASGQERTVGGIDYIRICPGTFTMGSADSEADADEKPAHQVTLSEFWLGKTEITNEQYRLFSSNHQGEAGLPATNVTWSEAQAACEYFGGRLPTEAQWEYAARAGSGTAWSFGGDESRLGEYAWFEGNSNKAARPVGTKKPNAWGLHDMHGNVWEWVADWYGPYPSAAQTDPVGPSTGRYRVLRGGAFFNSPRNLRSALRIRYEPELSIRDIGFRCARGPRRQP